MMKYEDFLCLNITIYHTQLNIAFRIVSGRRKNVEEIQTAEVELHWFNGHIVQKHPKAEIPWTDSYSTESSPFVFLKTDCVDV